MVVDRNKLSSLIERRVRSEEPDELSREGNVFFVGGALPARETLETLFESHCQAPADLFNLIFGEPDQFPHGVRMARLIKRNFNTHLLGRIDYPVTADSLEAAYAAGVDIIDIPIGVFDPAIADREGMETEARFQSLRTAIAIFPKWSVVATLLAGKEPFESTKRGIDCLLDQGIVPMVELSPEALQAPVEELAALFSHLATAWERCRVTTKPIEPRINLTTPLITDRPKGGLRGFVDKIHEKGLLAGSDLRRTLRVRRVEESFESAGL